MAKRFLCAHAKVNKIIDADEQLFQLLKLLRNNKHTKCDDIKKSKSLSLERPIKLTNFTCRRIECTMHKYGCKFIKCVYLLCNLSDCDAFHLDTSKRKKLKRRDIVSSMIRCDLQINFR